jgi:hypothetical protein
MPKMMTVAESVRLLKTLGISLTGLPKVGGALPKTKMGGLADKLHATRELRLALEKVAGTVKDEEQRLVDHIIDNTNLEVESGAVGRAYKAIVVREEVPQVEDWDKFYAHLLKTKNFSLLNKAVNRAAVKEIWDDGKKVPGVGKFQAKKISLTKV